VAKVRIIFYSVVIDDYIFYEDYTKIFMDYFC